MTRSQKRARIDAKRKAIQLLTLSGAIRPAHIEAHYRGRDMGLALPARTPQRELPCQQVSIWWMDLTAVFKVLQARQVTSLARSQRPAVNSRLAKRPIAPRAA
jgi:hypothetical protein